jgi:hypothetical protein
VSRGHDVNIVCDVIIIARCGGGRGRIEEGGRWKSGKKGRVSCLNGGRRVGEQRGRDLNKFKRRGRKGWG